MIFDRHLPLNQGENIHRTEDRGLFWQRSKFSSSTDLRTSVLLDVPGKAHFCFLAQLFDVPPAITYTRGHPTVESFGEAMIEEKIKRD